MTEEAPDVRNLSWRDLDDRGVEQADFQGCHIQIFGDGTAYVHGAYDGKHLIVTSVPAAVVPSLASYNATGKAYSLKFAERHLGGDLNHWVAAYKEALLK